MVKKKDFGLEGLERELRVAQEGLVLKLIPRLSKEKLVEDAARYFDNIYDMNLQEAFRDGRFSASRDPYSFILDSKSLTVTRNGLQIALVKSPKARELYAETHKRMEDYCPPF
jgi:hypothetical protein